MAAGIDQDVRTRLEDLACRYINLVYTAAQRQLGGEGRGAEDVTQAVFLIALQRAQAHTLPEEARMAGWLLKVTRYAVKNARREEYRHARRERIAAAARAQAAPDDGDADALRKVLDDGLLKLNAFDREVVARRYLQGQGIAELALAIGLTENTAGRRIARALEKLRKILTHRGIGLPAAGVAGVMLAECAKAAPAGVAASAAGVASGASVTAVGIAKGAAIMMKIVKMKLVAVAFVAMGVIACVTIIIVKQATHPVLASEAQATTPKADPPAVALNPTTSDPQQDALEAAKAKAAVLARVEQLQNISARYKHQVDYTFDPVWTREPLVQSRANPDITWGKVLSGTTESENTFSFLHGMARLESRRTGGTADLGIDAIRQIASADRYEQLYLERNENAYVLLGLIEKKRFPFLGGHECGVDHAVGLRGYNGEAWMDAAAISKNAAFVGHGATTDMIFEDPEKELKHIWTLDKSLGYAITRYSCTHDGFVCLELDNSEFKIVNGLVLPFRSRQQFLGKAHDGSVVAFVTDTVEVESYALGDTENVPSRYQMIWPKGTSVLDTRINKSIRIQSADRALSDEGIQTALKKGPVISLPDQNFDAKAAFERNGIDTGALRPERYPSATAPAPQQARTYPHPAITQSLTPAEELQQRYSEIFVRLHEAQDGQEALESLAKGGAKMEQMQAEQIRVTADLWNKIETAAKAVAAKHGQNAAVAEDVPRIPADLNQTTMKELQKIIQAREIIPLDDEMATEVVDSLNAAYSAPAAAMTEVQAIAEIKSYNAVFSRIGKPDGPVVSVTFIRLKPIPEAQMDHVKDCLKALSHLQILDLTRIKVTDDEAKALQDALPNCKILR